ncbi:sensor histidine kinase [Pseudoclavibacter endophyticus]|uniref:histidine kinase n=2 Tax=Pseudoclavibacter endophyticus TaxID=1778590 RepID=A0A6H9WHS0_9MICO|nr:sensor histidine kinase [Pseudoclavibacter endophyticus]
MAVLTAVGTAVAAVLLLFIIGSLSAADPAEHGVATPWSWWVTGVVVVLQAAAQLIPGPRSAGLLVAAALPLVLASVVPGPLFSVSAFPILVLAFLTGLQEPVRRVRWTGPAAGVLVAVGQLLNAAFIGRTDYAGMAVESALQAALVIGLPLLPATVIAGQRAIRHAQQETLDAMARERDAHIGEVIAGERAAMARELHDIAAHHLSGISLMAGAVERQVHTDPEAARAGAAAVRAQSRATLDDLRRLVGMLRDTDGGDESVKTLDTVPALVDDVAATGVDVRVDVRGPASDDVGEGIGPLAQLAVYRMVQESLANASRHAPGAACTVVLDDTDPARFRVSVRNAPPPAGSLTRPSGSGFGIIGMRERAALIGASFSAGPSGDDGWETRMSIPRESRRHRTEQHT